MGKMMTMQACLAARQCILFLLLWHWHIVAWIASLITVAAAWFSTVTLEFPSSTENTGHSCPSWDSLFLKHAVHWRGHERPSGWSSMGQINKRVASRTTAGWGTWGEGSRQELGIYRYSQGRRYRFQHWCCFHTCITRLDEAAFPRKAMKNERKRKRVKHHRYVGCPDILNLVLD